MFKEAGFHADSGSGSVAGGTSTRSTSSLASPSTQVAATKPPLYSGIPKIGILKLADGGSACCFSRASRGTGIGARRLV